jgi:two-component system chemotaxis response regulator CheY
MASKAVLVLLYREASAGADSSSADTQLLAPGDEYGGKERVRRVVVGNAAKVAERLETDQKIRKRIAIVDDDFHLRTTYSFVLEHLGYKTLIASDGDEIVNRVLDAKEAVPDVILMDYRMPKMNGLEAAKTILRNRPDIKIIISTADDSVRQEAISAGTTFLQKPFSLEELASAIRESLGGDASSADP